MFPDQVFGAAWPAAAPASTPVAAPEPAPVKASPPPPEAAAPATALDPVKVGGLTFKQLGIVAMVFVGVFAAMILTMCNSGGSCGKNLDRFSGAVVLEGA